MSPGLDFVGYNSSAVYLRSKNGVYNAICNPSLWWNREKMENTIKETGKVRYALTFAAFQPLKCNQQHHIRSIRHSMSDRA